MYSTHLGHQTSAQVGQTQLAAKATEEIATLTRTGITPDFATPEPDEPQVPDVAGNVAEPIATETGANGAFCAAGQQTCTAPEYAFVNYINREISPKLMVGFRSDLLNDKKGQRTGIAGKYTENTLYATKYIGNTIPIRPEIRFDHSWDRDGCNLGRAKNHFFMGLDLIYKF